MGLVDGYFQRFGYVDAQVAESPSDDLSIVVVIPCYDEPDLTGSLEALWACERPVGAVEVIVVVNSGENSSVAVRDQNLRTMREAGEWVKRHEDGRFRVYPLHFPDLPARHAGVGLARKIGMDEALGRLGVVGREEAGIVAGFDADCRCDGNYFLSLEEHFLRHPKTPGCSLYFEHPLSGSMDGAIYEAVTAYELHLRYYVEGMRWASIPHAFHTVGSSMAVRAAVYARQGGMNRRQAGEDFYFMHKVISLGGYTDLTGTRVIPSPRPSLRVPFGTGRAVSTYLELGEGCRTYPLQAIVDLGRVFPLVDGFRSGLGGVELSEALRTFLEAQGFEGALDEMRRHSGGVEGFRKRFWCWFDGFRVMKFIHHARDRYYGGQEVSEAAAGLMGMLVGEGGGPVGVGPGGAGMRELLDGYRVRARSAGPAVA